MLSSLLWQSINIAYFQLINAGVKIVKKITLIAGLSMLLLVAMAAPALAKEDVGVQVGDWFKYEVKVTQYESEGPFPPTYSPLTLADNETNSITYNVTDITLGDGGDNVTFAITYDWKNSSITYATMVENVSTADTTLMIIGANMSEGDMVSDMYSFMGMQDIPARYLNESIMLENPNATRETNVLNYSMSLFDSPYDYTFLWDKATGMRVYYENHGDVAELNVGVTQPAYIYTVVWELVDSSVDGLLIPDLTGPILLLTLMSITVPVALLHRRKKPTSI
jgi:hypothetical protein